jgi:O-antigen/teichoic acid export membrane protein
LLSAAGTAVLIQLASGKRDNEVGETIKLMHQSGKILSSIVFPLFFFLLFYRTELIVTVFTEKYIPAIPVFLAAILVIPVRAYSFTTILQRQHKGNIINIGALSELLLACALMYPLYKWLGLPGVALSFVISTYLQAAFYLFHSGRLLNVSPLQLIPYKNWLVKLIIFATLFISIHYISREYFGVEIALILGGAVMVSSIMLALFIEIRKQRVYGSD